MLTPQKVSYSFIRDIRSLFFCNSAWTEQPGCQGCEIMFLLPQSPLQSVPCQNPNPVPLPFLKFHNWFSVANLPLNSISIHLSIPPSSILHSDQTASSQSLSVGWEPHCWPRHIITPARKGVDRHETHLKILAKFKPTKKNRNVVLGLKHLLFPLSAPSSSKVRPCVRIPSLTPNY